MKLLNWTPLDFKLTTNNSIHSYRTKTSKNLHIPKANINWGKQNQPIKPRRTSTTSITRD